MIFLLFIFVVVVVPCIRVFPIDDHVSLYSIPSFYLLGFTLSPLVSIFPSFFTFVFCCYSCLFACLFVCLVYTFASCACAFSYFPFHFVFVFVVAARNERTFICFAFLFFFLFSSFFFFCCLVCRNGPNIHIYIIYFFGFNERKELSSSQKLQFG